MAKSKHTTADAKNASAKKTASRAPVEKALAANDPAESLRQLKLKMEATRAKLMLVKPDNLSDEEHDAWSNQITKTNLAITGLRNAALENLTNEFKQALPAFEAATTKLADDLAKLTQAVEIIKAVSGALGVITKIANLLG